MDTGRLELSLTSYGSIPYTSLHGGGLRYSYFDPESRLDEILLITPSITLLSTDRVGRLPHPIPLPDQTAMIFSLMKSQSRPAPHEWLPIPEQLGMYLVMRVASRSSLIYFTSWYSESMGRASREILTLRSTVREHQLLRGHHACRCMCCEVKWLVQGWICPWSRLER